MTAVDTPIKHGTLSGYRWQDCRCDDCHAAHVMACKRWRVRTARNGPDKVDILDARRILVKLRKRGLGVREIGRQAGLDHATLVRVNKGHGMVYRTTLVALEKLWDDLRPQDPRAQWETEPLRAMAERKLGSLTAGGSAFRRNVARAEKITTDSADKYAGMLGCHPVEIWADWYDRAV